MTMELLLDIASWLLLSLGGIFVFIGGLGALRMPWTMTAFTIGALSMIGVPPTGGFVSKWYILAGAF